MPPHSKLGGFRASELRGVLREVITKVTTKDSAQEGSTWHSGASVRIADHSEQAPPKKAKTPENNVVSGGFPVPEKKEAPVGVEPTMADLQSAALATWLRSL